LTIKGNILALFRHSGLKSLTAGGCVGIHALAQGQRFYGNSPLAQADFSQVVSGCGGIEAVEASGVEAHRSDLAVCRLNEQ
jgi:hypothetical protein